MKSTAVYRYSTLVCDRYTNYKTIQDYYENLRHYGTILTSQDFVDFKCNGGSMTSVITLTYNDDIYYVEMTDGKVVCLTNLTQRVDYI